MKLLLNNHCLSKVNSILRGGITLEDKIMMRDRAWHITEDVSKANFEYIDTQKALTAMAIIICQQQAQIIRLLNVAVQNTPPVD